MKCPCCEEYKIEKILAEYDTRCYNLIGTKLFLVIILFIIGLFALFAYLAYQQVSAFNIGLYLIIYFVGVSHFFDWCFKWLIKNELKKGRTL